MEHTYASRLRYLDADAIDDSTVDFSGLAVRGHDDAKLGDIDGFIVDADSGRLYHLVVDSGGWFSSRRFLLPVGHATVDREAGAVRVDVARGAIERYPEFDPGRFRSFSDDDLRAFERRTHEACCPDDRVETESTWPYETRRHFTQPAWWGTGAYRAERLRPIDAGATPTGPARERYDRELVTAREPADRSGDLTRRPDEDSPHFEGRAQPGDVLGLETGGERTYVGDTSEDENERRREAEKRLRDERK